MTKFEKNALSDLVHWITNAIDSSIDQEPPHTHLDVFFENWCQLSEEEYGSILKSISLSTPSRYIVLVFQVADEQVKEDWCSWKFCDFLSRSIDIGVPPAIYLPARNPSKIIVDYHCISRYRLPSLDRSGYRARLNVIQWDRGDANVDATLDFLCL